MLFDLLGNPMGFFESVKRENWRPSFKFFLVITAILSVATPFVNYLGIESNDLSSAYQAQILAYRVSKILMPQYGVYTYFIEAFLIMGFALVYLLFLTVFVHLVFRLMGGKGSALNAWKSSCYGVAPCVLGGFLPYVSLLAAAYSLLLQLYIGPKTMYGVEESRAIAFLAVVLALTFFEMLMRGTTVEFLI